MNTTIQSDDVEIFRAWAKCHRTLGGAPASVVGPIVRKVEHAYANGDNEAFLDALDDMEEIDGTFLVPFEQA